MKKLIMLSAFALSTIGASASNDLFKNYYVEKADQIQPVEFTYNYVVYIYKDVFTISLTPYRTVNYTCITPTEFSYSMFILKESYLNPPFGTKYRFVSQQLGLCFGGPITLP